MEQSQNVIRKFKHCTVIVRCVKYGPISKHLFQIRQQHNGWERIRVPKVPFRFFEKLKNKIQSSVLTFCFYFNKKNEIQIN